MGRKSYMPSLEELRKLMSELDSKLTQQHGRKGTVAETEEQERKRLWNNYKQRLYKQSVKDRAKREDEAFDVWDGNPDRKPDEYGITPIDERRYKNCFRSYYIGFPIEVDYIKRMTGLTIAQIFELQSRTGYKPTPEITKSQAERDRKYRELTGDIY